MTNPVCATILNGLPDGFLAVAFPGVNCDIEILALNEMKGIDMLLRRVAAFFTGEIKTDNAPRPEIDRQFRHLQRAVHVAHAADQQAGSDAEVLAAAF